MTFFRSLSHDAFDRLSFVRSRFSLGFVQQQCDTWHLFFPVFSWPKYHHDGRKYKNRLVNNIHTQTVLTFPSRAPIDWFDLHLHILQNSKVDLVYEYHIMHGDCVFVADDDIHSKWHM